MGGRPGSPIGFVSQNRRRRANQLDQGTFGLGGFLTEGGGIAAGFVGSFVGPAAAGFCQFLVCLVVGLFGGSTVAAEEVEEIGAAGAQFFKDGGVGVCLIGFERLFDGTIFQPA